MQCSVRDFNTNHTMALAAGLAYYFLLSLFPLLVVLAGLLLFLPGFLTDLVGVALLIAPVRRWCGRTFRLWDVDSGKSLFAQANRNAGGMETLAWLGDRLVVPGYDGMIRVLDSLGEELQSWRSGMANFTIPKHKADPAADQAIATPTAATCATS